MPATSALLQEGRYRLDHPIAESSESSVFQGYDTVRDTKVVIKEIVARMNTGTQQENLKINFANQAKALASIRHDSLIQVEDYFSEVGRQYLVMESVEGEDLESIIGSSKTPFNLDEAVSWIEQVLEALQYLHNFDPPLLHRQVRPGNVRRLLDGRVKLLAYSSPDGEMPLSTGMAADEGSTPTLNYAPLELIWEGLDAASQKVILGTYDDRSEKILKSQPDARSDIYSVGATLYYLLTTCVPIDPLERSIEMLEGNPDPLQAPKAVNNSIPDEVSDVVMRAMEIKRENRFDSAAIMRQVLRTAANKAQEQDDDRELAEAAEALKIAEETRAEQTRRAAEQTQRELDEEKRRVAEELQIAAERKAAEAKQKPKKEKSRKQPADVAVHTSQRSTVTDENPLELAEESENAVRPNTEAKAEGIEINVDSVERFVAVDRGSDASSSNAPQAAFEESESPFSYEETRPGSKLPVMIGALVVLMLAGVGGWVFLGSGAAKEQPAPAQTAPSTTAPSSPTEAAEQPAATGTTPQAESAVPETPEAVPQAPSAEPSQTRTAPKPTPTKAAKPTNEPAKTAEKKKVTVDDLINDN